MLKKLGWMTLQVGWLTWGEGPLHSQVEYHVRDKFATSILYGIDNL